ncbi:hypothetical protein V5740_01855 [Croceibacterium sp. TMG7-5b_MA50]
MTQTTTIAQQTVAALSAFAMTATMLFASFAPPAQTAEQTVAIAETLA